MFSRRSTQAIKYIRGRLRRLADKRLKAKAKPWRGGPFGGRCGRAFRGPCPPAIRAAIRDFSARVARAGPENAQGRAFPRLAPPRPRHGTGQNRGFCSVHVLFSRRAGRPARGMRRRRALRPAHGRRRGFAQGPLRKGTHGLIGIHNVTQPEPESAPAGRAGEGEQLGSEILTS